jgi:hypothetical protein
VGGGHVAEETRFPYSQPSHRILKKVLGGIA